MKLAEALIERADLQRKMKILRERMVDNAKVQEGLEPNEKVEDLIDELNKILSRLEYLIIHINKTNELTKMEDGGTISEAIARKDMLAKRISIIGDLLDSGNALTNRYSRSEIKVTPTFAVATMQKEVDGLSKELRTLDTELQKSNWITELI